MVTLYALICEPSKSLVGSKKSLGVFEMTVKKIPKIAVVGGRTWGHMHLRAFSQLQRNGDCNLVALVDLDESILSQRSAEFGISTFTDLDTMLDEVKPDGVSIAVPDHLHHQVAAKCLSRGCHVLIEKPMDVTSDGCRKLIALASEKDLIIQIEFMKRKDPYHIDLEQRIAKNQLGKVQYGYAWMEDRIEVPRDWLPRWASESDPAWFLGVHMFDLARWLIKSNAVAVSATASKGKLLEIGINTFDSVSSKIIFDSGASFSIDVAWHLPDGNEAIVNQGIKVVGSEGWMTVDTQDRGARGCLAGAISMAVGSSDRTLPENAMFTPNLGLFTQTNDRWGQPQYTGYGIESIQDFGLNLGFVMSGGKISDLSGKYPSGEDGLEVTKIAEAVHQSIERGGELIKILQEK